MSLKQKLSDWYWGPREPEAKALALPTATHSAPPAEADPVLDAAGTAIAQYTAVKAVSRGRVHTKVKSPVFSLEHRPGGRVHKAMPRSLREMKPDDDV